MIRKKSKNTKNVRNQMSKKYKSKTLCPPQRQWQWESSIRHSLASHNPEGTIFYHPRDYQHAQLTVVGHEENGTPAYSFQ